jgi:hypothetical protein
MARGWAVLKIQIRWTYHFPPQWPASRPGSLGRPAITHIELWHRGYRWQGVWAMNSRSVSIGLSFISSSIASKSTGSETQMGQFSTSAGKLSSEEHFTASSGCSEVDLLWWYTQLAKVAEAVSEPIASAAGLTWVIQALLICIKVKKISLYLWVSHIWTNGPCLLHFAHILYDRKEFGFLYFHALPLDKVGIPTPIIL